MYSKDDILNIAIRLLTSRILFVIICVVVAVPALAQMPPSLNLSGQVGLIDMPAGEQQADGFLAFEHSNFGPIDRNALRFQIAPRLSGVFRYVGLEDYEKNLCQPNCTAEQEAYTYYDRNFDVS